MGIILDLLHREKPFCDWSAGQLISTVKGAVRREHYVIAKDGPSYMGAACWGLCRADIAEAYLRGQRQPSYDECLGGDTTLIFVIQARSASAVKVMTDMIRQQAPGPIAARRFRASHTALAPVRLKNRIGAE
jgi:hypothetical protein